MVKTLEAPLEYAEPDAESVEKDLQDVSEVLEGNGSPKGEELERRWRAYRGLRDKVLQIARNPQRQKNPLIRDLLDRTLELQRRLEDDVTGQDPEWRVQEIVDDLSDVLSTLEREAEHLLLDDPVAAARFVVHELGDIEQEQVGEILGVGPRTIRTWKSGSVSEIRKDRARVVLVAQLVYDLRNSMTSRGVVMWFHRSRPQLGDATPLNLIEQSVPDAYEPLRAIARGGRGQLAT